MRIIAGEGHGRRLKAPSGSATRPTAARVRESLFSRLAARTELEELAVLDLFAGSGSLGIEALSRGARHAVFVDSSRAAAAAINANLNALGLSRRARVLTMEVSRALGRLAADSEQFDLIFSDPPYRHNTGANTLRRLLDLDLLRAGGWLAAEMSRCETAPPDPRVEQVSVAAIGDHRIALYRRSVERRVQQEREER